MTMMDGDEVLQILLLHTQSHPLNSTELELTLTQCSDDVIIHIAPHLDAILRSLISSSHRTLIRTLLQRTHSQHVCVSVETIKQVLAYDSHCTYNHTNTNGKGEDVSLLEAVLSHVYNNNNHYNHEVHATLLHYLMSSSLSYTPMQILHAIQYIIANTAIEEKELWHSTLMNTITSSHRSEVHYMMEQCQKQDATRTQQYLTHIQQHMPVILQYLTTNANHDKSEEKNEDKAVLGGRRPGSEGLRACQCESDQQFDNLCHKLTEDLNQTHPDFWQTRMNALTLLREYIAGGILLMDDDSSSNYGVRMMHTIQHDLPIIDQITDARSQITREVCDLIADMAYTLTNTSNTACSSNQHILTQFRIIVEQYLPYLLKLSTSGIRVMATQGEQCIRSVLCFMEVPRVLSMLCEGCMQMKQHHRYKKCCAMGITIALKLWSNVNITNSNNNNSNNNNMVCKALLAAMSDRDPDVREQGRAMYWAMQERFPGMAEGVWSTLDSTNQGRLLKCQISMQQQWQQGGIMYTILHGNSSASETNDNSKNSSNCKNSRRASRSVSKRDTGISIAMTKSRGSDRSSTNSNKVSSNTRNTCDAADKPWRRKKKATAVATSTPEASNNLTVMTKSSRTNTSLSSDKASSIPNTRRSTMNSSSTAGNTDGTRSNGNGKIAVTRRRTSMVTKGGSSGSQTLSILAFLQRASDSVWSTREGAFLDLTRQLTSSSSNGNQMSDAYHKNATQFVSCLVDRILDAHPRVHRAALEATRVCFTRNDMTDVLEPHLSVLLPAILSHHHSHSKVNEKCLQQIYNKLPAMTIVSIILRVLRDHANTDRVQLASLQELQQMIEFQHADILHYLSTKSGMSDILDVMAIILGRKHAVGTGVQGAVDEVLCRVFEINEDLFASQLCNLPRSKYLILDNEISGTRACQAIHETISSQTDSPRSNSTSSVTSICEDISHVYYKTENNTTKAPLQDISSLNLSSRAIKSKSPPEKNAMNNTAFASTGWSKIDVLETPKKVPDNISVAPETDPVLRYIEYPPMSTEKKSFDTLNDVMKYFQKENKSENIYFVMQSLIRLLKQNDLSFEENHVMQVCSCLIGKDIKFDTST